MICGCSTGFVSGEFFMKCCSGKRKDGERIKALIHRVPGAVPALLTLLAAGVLAVAVAIPSAAAGIQADAGTWESTTPGALSDDTYLVASVTEQGEGTSRVDVAYDPGQGTIAAVSSGDAAGVVSRPTPGALLDPLQIELFPCGAWNNMAGKDAPLLTVFHRWSYTNPSDRTNTQTFTLQQDGKLERTPTGTYSYDSQGRLAGITSRSGGRMSVRAYEYDSSGRLAVYTVTQAGSGPVRYRFTYDSDGQLVRSESDDGSWCSYIYKDGTLAARRDHSGVYGGLQERRYVYDGNGRLSLIRFYRNGALEAADTFSYVRFGDLE